MPSPAVDSQIVPKSSEKKSPFFGLQSSEMDELVLSWHWPKFRAKQVRQWVYDQQRIDPAGMSNLAKRDQLFLSEHVDFLTAQVIKQQQSSDGTIKLLAGWISTDDLPGQDPITQAECVMIPDGDRRTACVSSQVGCPAGCRFCASGIGGLKKNLSAAQIVEQVILLNRAMMAKRLIDAPLSQNLSGDADKINHIVFMGMGEPLANYANLLQAIRVIHDPECLNIGARKITVSTVGIPLRMRQLAEESLPINLAISLHAPTESLRKQLIPWAEHFALDEILSAARYYFDQTGREITLEYILLSGVNDQAEHARQLVRLCGHLRCNVNLIRYNEVPGLGFGRPSAQDVMAFQNILRDGGVNAHVRKSRGRDIDAACGQLRRKTGSAGPELVTLTSVGSLEQTDQPAPR